jgi:hypothetical protein
MKAKGMIKTPSITRKIVPTKEPENPVKPVENRK